jgi:uncharacterized membrane protein YgdD (TMEM256/DUF423 family)
MSWAAFAAFALAIAVGLGAFGAHGLRSRLDAYSLGIWEKAVFYHFVHALGVLAGALLARTGIAAPSEAWWASLLFAVGIVLFSGSLYLLAVSGTRWLGAVTPVGGVLFIAGWLALAWGILSARN